MDNIKYFFPLNTESSDQAKYWYLKPKSHNGNKNDPDQNHTYPAPDGCSGSDCWPANFNRCYKAHPLKKESDEYFGPDSRNLKLHCLSGFPLNWPLGDIDPDKATVQLNMRRNIMKQQAKWMPFYCGSDYTRVPCTKTLLDWMAVRSMPGADVNHACYCPPGGSRYVKSLRECGMIDLNQPDVKAAFLPAVFFNRKLFDEALFEIPSDLSGSGDTGYNHIPHDFDVSANILTGFNKIADATEDWGWWGPSDLKNGEYDSDYWKANGQNWPDWITNPTARVANKGYGWPQCTDEGVHCPEQQYGQSPDTETCSCYSAEDCSPFCGDAWKMLDQSRSSDDRKNPVEWGFLGETGGAEDCGALAWTQIGPNNVEGWSMMSQDCYNGGRPHWDGGELRLGEKWGEQVPRGTYEQVPGTEGDYHSGFPMCMVMYPEPPARESHEKSCLWQSKWTNDAFRDMNPDTFAEEWAQRQDNKFDVFNLIKLWSGVGGGRCDNWFEDVPPSPPPKTRREWRASGGGGGGGGRGGRSLEEALEDAEIALEEERERFKRLAVMTTESDNAREKYKLQVFQHYGHLDNPRRRASVKRRLFSTNPGGVVGNEQLPNNQNLVVADMDNTGTFDLIVHSYAPHDGDCAMRCSQLGRLGFSTFTVDDAEVPAATDMYCFCGPKLDSYKAPRENRVFQPSPHSPAHAASYKFDV
jgi:hypothetical protein